MNMKNVYENYSSLITFKFVKSKLKTFLCEEFLKCLSWTSDKERGRTWTEYLTVTKLSPYTLKTIRFLTKFPYFLLYTHNF